MRRFAVSVQSAVSRPLIPGPCRTLATFRPSSSSGQRKVMDVMTRGVALAQPEDTVMSVAQMMDKEDAGAIPVQANDRLVGMVTDRDIAVRLAATGKDPARTKVREVMSQGTPLYCYEDEDVGHIARVMGEQQVRRLPVMNRDKRLVGIVSLANVTLAAPSDMTAEAVKGVTSGGKHGGQHNPQSQDAARYDRPAQP